MIAGGAAVVWVDLYAVASMADVAARLDDALAKVPGAFGRLAQRFAATLALNLGVVRFELRGRGAPLLDPSLTADALLDVLTRAASEHPTVVCFDEFSDIDRVPGAAGLLRTKLQHHYRSLGILFAGSEPSLMRMLFTEQNQPFYAQADLVEIGPLSAAEVVDIVTAGFADTGRDAGPLPARIADFSGGHPQRAMQTADTAWRLTAPGTSADDATWIAALDALRAATADGNERLYSSLQGGEQGVLRVLAGGGSVFGSAARVLDLHTGTAQNARKRLVERGHVVGDGGSYTIVDPVFADWIRRRFPL